MKSWKTTLTAIIVIAGAIVDSFFPEYREILIKVIAAATAAGLYAARDNDKTSEQAGAK